MRKRVTSSLKHPFVAATVLASALIYSVANAAEVNVYSYRQPDLINPVFKQFTDETGIKVNTVFAKQGLIERLRTEGQNSPADLVLSTDSGPLEAAMSADLLAPVANETLEAAIPSAFRDSEGRWFGLTNRARIIVTAKNPPVAKPISRYEDLTDPAYRGMICTRSGKHPYMIALIASMIAHSGEEEARAWLTGVKANRARKPQGNDRAQVKAIWQGECDIALINSYYMGQMLADEEQQAWANSVNILFPNQADRGTHVNISGVSLTKSSPNRDSAIQLMEFLASESAQSIYAEQNYEYPINPAVPSSALVQSWGEFKADELPLSEIGQHRARAVMLVDETGYDN